jgi:nucleoside-triphosphatase THEP1
MSLALLIGDRHSGKTSMCRRLADALRGHGLSVGGIIAPAVHEGDRCIAYEVVDLATGRSVSIATTVGPGVQQTGRFHFLAEGLAFGKAAIEQAVSRSDDLIFVDEVGPLELTGGGWCEQVDKLAGRRVPALLTVRRSLAQEVADRWDVTPESRCDLTDGLDAVAEFVMRFAKRVS